MASNDPSYVASGFNTDCAKLLNIFKSNGSIRFDAFCHAWVDMKFSLVFTCRRNYGEMLEFCEEALNIAKEICVSETQLIDQIGGLYLLYGLYYKMPLDGIKIRVTLKEWKVLLNLHQKVRNEKLYDASYIFVKLISSNAFYHCLFSKECGLEKYFSSQKEESVNSHSTHTVLPNIIDDIENGELSSIQNLSDIYVKEKEKLINASSKYKLELFKSNFVEEIIDNVQELQNKRKDLVGFKSKHKEFNFGIKSDEKKNYNTDDKVRPKLGHGFDTDSSEEEEMTNYPEYVACKQNANLNLDESDDEPTNNLQASKEDSEENVDDDDL